MQLIDNTSEFKIHFSAISVGFDLVNIQSHIDEAIDAQLIPAIGRRQFELLVNGKGTLSGENQKALKYLQKSAVGFSMADYTSTGAIEITNAGISVVKGTSRAPASDKKLMSLRKQASEQGFSALENCIIYIEDNIDLFPIYKDSDERKANRSLLINTSKEYQDSGVNINRSVELYQTLRTYQPDIEKLYIRNWIGESLYSKLKAITFSGGGSERLKELLKEIRRPIANLTMMEAIPYMAISMDASGIYQLNETVGGISGNVENRTAAEIGRLQGAMWKLQVKADSQIEFIKQWIVENKSDFEEYKTSEPVVINDGSAPNIFFI